MNFSFEGIKLEVEQPVTAAASDGCLLGVKAFLRRVQEDVSL
jgi:hypothetical protein